MVILDTSIIIDHLRTRPLKQSLLVSLVEKQPKQTIAISMITVQELYEGRSTLDLEKEKDLLATISPLQILPYTYEIAKLAGQLARDLPRPIELADAAIAATAIFHDARLFSQNHKDFQAIPNLDLI